MADPAGGSHYVETLTDQLARRGWAVMREIEAAGGATEALASGWLGSRLTASRDARRVAAAEGELLVTGVERLSRPGGRAAGAASRQISTRSPTRPRADCASIAAGEPKSPTSSWVAFSTDSRCG